MKAKRLLLSAILISGLFVPLISSSTSLDSESPDLNNPNPQGCGVSLSVADVMRNADDDQNKQSHASMGSPPHEVLDREHRPSKADEDDLKACVITGTAGPFGGLLTLEEKEGQTKYDGVLWKDPNKHEKLYERSWNVEPYSSRFEVFYIEGYEISDKKNDIVMKASMDCPGGIADGKLYMPAHSEKVDKATVWEADLDIDSKNEKGVDPPAWGIDTEDDKIEHSETEIRPGKVLITTMGKDTDLDGTPDFADGLGLPPQIGGGTSGGVGGSGNTDGKLVPIRVHLREPIATKDAKVSFAYEASIPRLDTDQGDIVMQGNGSADSPRLFFLNTTGLRIWAVDAPQRSDSPETAQDITKDKPARKFVPAGKEIAWKDLCAAVAGSSPSGDPPREIVLYLEYAEAPPPPQSAGSGITGGLPPARPSGVADLRKSIMVTETSESHGIARDLVHVSLSFIDLDVNGNLSLTDPCDGLRNYMPGYQGPDPKIHDTSKTSFESATYKQAQGADCGGMKLMLMGVGSDIVDKAEFKIIRATSIVTWNTPTSSFCGNAEKNGANTGAKDVSFSANADKGEIDGQIDATKTHAPIYCKDYGAWAEVEIKLTKGGKPVAQPILVRLPFDYNDDRIADIWQYGQILAWNQRYPGTPPIPENAAGLAHFAPNSDLEMADSDGTGPLPPPPNPSCPYPPMAADGDGLTVHKEYRGYIFDGGPGAPPGGHKRLSAVRKDLLVECSEMVGAPFAPGYSLAGTMGAVWDFFRNEGQAAGNPGYFVGAIVDTYWVRDALNDTGTYVTYADGTSRLAYKHTGTYTDQSGNNPMTGTLCIGMDYKLLYERPAICRNIYGPSSAGSGILAPGNGDNRNPLCEDFVKLVMRGKKGIVVNDGTVRMHSQTALEVDETNGVGYQYHGAFVWANSIAEQQQAAPPGSTPFPDELAFAVAHELGHLFIIVVGGDDHFYGTNNLMLSPPPGGLPNTLFMKDEIEHINLPDRASVAP